MNKLFFLLAFPASLLFISVSGFSQPMEIVIANCDGKFWFGRYHDYLSKIDWCLAGKGKFQEDSLLKFNKNSGIQTKDLDKKNGLFKKYLPNDFYTEYTKIIRLNTKPNEDGRIWFDCIYAEQDFKGKITIYCGYKTIYDGADPIEISKHPEINQLVLLQDENQLRPYYDLINKLLAANGIILPPRPKDNSNSLPKEKPPEVELPKSQ